MSSGPKLGLIAFGDSLALDAVKEQGASMPSGYERSQGCGAPATR